MSAKYFTVQSHILPGQYIREYPGATLDSQEDVLKLHIKQYTPLESERTKPKGITIIGAHANGFPKELYEPLWDELYLHARASNVVIGGIWVADVAHMGLSYVLNEEKLGNDPSWKDHSRDLLHIINHFRDQMPRPLVGIGHSMGGANLVDLSIMHPRLLSTLILIDPVFHSNPFAGPESDSSTYARLSAFRRDIWPSRSVAASSFEKSPLFKSWDPRVLSLWNEFALRELPTAIFPDAAASSATDSTSGDNPQSRPVTLTATKHQEVFTYLRPNFPTPAQPVVNRATHPDIDKSLLTAEKYPFYRPESASAFQLLPRLLPSTLYIFGGSSDVSSPESNREKIETTGIGVGGSGGIKDGRVKEVVLEGIGHLIPMAVPKHCAEQVLQWLAPELQRWRDEEETWTRNWKAASRRDRQALSEEYKRMLGGNPREKTASEKM